MVESFGEYASPTDTIAAILGTYPFSIGLFRELIQNSDDAKASKQVFVLDSRLHPTNALFHPRLSDAQGPSLLAFNDALFSQEDWEALQSIHRSSKKTDTSKIGKYGIGFRSCYHVTDTPQILSGSSLAVLDPQHIFSQSGGAKFDIDDYPDHRATFDFFPAGGSVIRLPLRKQASTISKQIVTAQEVRTLFADFIREELSLALLFLKHVKRVEIWEIDVSGRRTQLAGASISKGAPTLSSFVAQVDIDAISSRRWRIFHSEFSQHDSAASMCRRLGRDVRPLLDKHKLFPNLAIAVPLDGQEEESGRLFTFLPLPIRTGFPCHVHGLFALTQSRQNLSNKSEVGVVRGSDDSVLIEWNQMLFDEYLPKTWATLLPILIESDAFDAQQIYGVWPPRQAHVDTGDSLYWKDIPLHLLAAVVASQTPVWPVISPSSSPSNTSFRTLHYARVASNTIDPAAVQAMVNAGVSITQPPAYIQEMLGAANMMYLALIPKTAHFELLNHIPALETLPAVNKAAILEYLLSQSDLECILDLPVVPRVNGGFAALERASSSSARHTFLETSALNLFAQFDGSAISLKGLSESAYKLLVEQGPTVLNLTELVPSRVVEYLCTSFFGLDFSTTQRMASVNEVVVLWLSKFWVWVGQWESHKNELLTLIGHFYLLPSRTTRLVSPDDGIFLDADIDPRLTPALQQLDIPFAHPIFSQAARDVVKSLTGAMRAPRDDIHSLLDRLIIPSDIHLDKQRSDLLLSFVVQAVLDMCRAKPLDEKQQRALRSLPIFPILLPSPNLVKPEKSSRLFSALQSKASKTNTIRIVGPIPAHNTVYGVTSATASLLPLAHDITFLDGSHIDLAILAHLQPENNVPLSEVDVVGLSLEHFAQQSKFLLTAFMEYMVQHRESLPPRLLKTLQNVKFIPVLDGTLQSPAHVVDPASALTALYSDSGDRVPRSVPRGEDDAGFILKQLRILGILRGTVTADIVHERIQHISAIREINGPSAKALAIRLIDLLYMSGFDASQLDIPADAKWVPTNRGMLGHEECMDRGLHRPELFDEVFPLVDDTVNVSPSLRMALGWDKPIALVTLTQQLKMVIALGKPEVTYKKTRTLIKELSQRALSEDDLLTLRGVTSDAPWIPISHHHIASTSHAVFYLPIALPGFYEIPLVMSERPDVRALLEKVGCTERPGTEILIAELHKLSKMPPSNEKLQASLMVLKALPLTLTDDERAEMLVPDMYCNLMPAKDIFFNDIGDRAYLEAGDLPLAHPRVDEHTAKRLHISRLGLKFLHLKNPGPDMGEKLTTTIRNVLKQYTEQQTLTEFLANASDAGASNFKILVDDRQAPTEQLLTPAMAPFQRCPSLVVYNDSVFTQKDFDGICRTGVGGKEGKTNTIGQFGLGALSMFHFTELAMIVSGDKVLFLDPSKSHLPLDDWASLLLPLQQMQRLYPDHLAALDGLFDFKLSSTENYNATLFRLPLRGASHINEHSILQTVRDSEYVRDHIVRPYWRIAQQSLLFSKIASISTFYRTASGRIIRGWSLHVERDNFTTHEAFSQHRLRITGYVAPDAKPAQDSWKVVSSTRPISALPAELTSLIEPNRLRSPISAGFAARTTSLQHQTSTSHNIFSTLPLPMTTTLPVHLTASFILTPDRRHIRFDDYDNLETKYNRWLLSSVGPPLYLYLLHTLYQELGMNNLWWPGNTTQQDNVTSVLVNAFYKDALPSSSLAVCSSYFVNVQMRPADAVLLGSEPEDVTAVLRHLRIARYMRLPPIVSERASGTMQPLTPSVLKSDLALFAFRLISLYEKGTVTVHDIQTIIRYLQEDSTLDLKDLPLVPLASGTLVPLESDTYKNKYYVWRPSAPDRQLWDLGVLVHPEFDAECLVDKGFNVMKLTGSEVARLLRLSLPESSPYTNDTAAHTSWMHAFWKEYPSFELHPDFNAKEFPLVPTLRAGHYVSVSACQTDCAVMVLSTEDAEPAWLGACLDVLGVSVVRRHDPRLPAEITNVLQALPHFRVDPFLRFMDSSSGAYARFALLGSVERAQFAGWCQNQVTQASPQYLSAAMKLPIWEAGGRGMGKGEGEGEGEGGGRGEGVHYLPATDVLMLPYNFPSDVLGPFAKPTWVAFSPGLRHLGVQPKLLNEIWAEMERAEYLPPGDTAVYKRMVAAMVGDPTFAPPRRSILVPNGERRLVESDTLYGREPLFLAAFGSGSGSGSAHFVLEEFVDLEARLVGFGLKVPRTLDLETFVLCAAAIHGDVVGAEREQRARLVFQAYAEDLPVRLAGTGTGTGTGVGVGVGGGGEGGDGDGWTQLEGLRFIPRGSMRQRKMRIEEYSSYTKPLPPVVAPREILLPEYEGIAWTQRAVLAERPSERLLVANLAFGKPTTGEVINHLRILATEVARDFTGNRHVLSDLTATYKWLDENQDEVGDELIALHQERLFLNVNDPSVDVWMWDCADDMFLNIVDNGEDSLKAVRGFLQPFRDLLYVAGVEEIMNPPAPQPVFSSVEAQFVRLKAGYEGMRREGRLTDVVFVSEYGEGERFPAHRSFLAPMSEYLNDLFCGEFTEAGPASAEEPVEVVVDYPAACVRIVMDFIYTSAPPDFGDLGLPVLLDVLDLSAYWGFIELHDVTQAQIISGNFINPLTYGDILQRATVLDAQFLLEACEYYETQNRDAIERLKGGTRQPRRNPRYIPKKSKSKWDDWGRERDESASTSKPPAPRTRKVTGVRKMMHRISSSWSRSSKSNRNIATTGAVANP